MKRMMSNDRAASFVRALVHGDSGIGKTTSILTLPTDRTFVAISERGALPLRKAKFSIGLLENWEDCRQLVIDHKEPKEDSPKILVVDSLTECSEICKRQIVQVDRRALIKDRTSGKSDKPSGIYDDLMAMEDWNLYASRMNGFISAVCHLPMHVIFTALSIRKENKKTGEQIIAPDVNGALAFECPAYFDIVLHMHNAEEATEGGKKQVRYWRTANNGEVLAKDASASLDELEQTNWMTLFGKILGTGGKAEKEKVK